VAREVGRRRNGGESSIVEHKGMCDTLVGLLYFPPCYQRDPA